MAWPPFSPQEVGEGRRLQAHPRPECRGPPWLEFESSGGHNAMQRSRLPLAVVVSCMSHPRSTPYVYN
eukprot:scaffold260688_cov27-Tisochrysis_lutea.AAC.1